MHIFLWTNPCRKFQNKDMMGKVLKFMLEINKGAGGTSAKNAQHAREAQITFPRCTVSILSKCSFTFVQVLSQPCLKIQIWWTTIKRNKIIASTLGSMQFELWNMILINHGCEQQIKNDGILSKKKILRHFSNICCPLTFCRECKEYNQGASWTP